MILFYLSGIIFTVMTGSLYIIPLITRLNISQINNTIALSERSAQILISDVSDEVGILLSAPQTGLTSVPVTDMIRPLLDQPERGAGQRFSNCDVCIV